MMGSFAFTRHLNKHKISLWINVCRKEKRKSKHFLILSKIHFDSQSFHLQPSSFTRENMLTGYHAVHQIGSQDNIIRFIQSWRKRWKWMHISNSLQCLTCQSSSVGRVALSWWFFFKDRKEVIDRFGSRWRSFSCYDREYESSVSVVRPATNNTSLG